MFRQHSGPVVRCHAGLAFAIGLTVTLIGHVGAQTIFDACYTDKTGVIYLIDPTGKNPANLPLECAKTGKHVQFTWIDAKGAQHAGLTGLRDDDHPQYLLTTGVRPMTGDLIVRSKVGIGVTTASAPLTLLPVDGADIEFASGTGDNADIFAHNAFNIGTLSNHPVSLLTQGQFRLFVAGDGKVGVGTYQPTEQLTVAGTVESTTGGFKFPDGSVQTSAAASGAPAVLADGVTGTTNGFAVTGAFGIGSIAATGGGVRLMWYPAQGAFRAGGVLGSRWDAASIGSYSVALGFSTQASGQTSTAIGQETVASAHAATATGYQTEAQGVASTAMGHQTQALGFAATAMGVQSHAVADASTAIGSFATATAAASTAIGTSVEASGENSTAMGMNASTNGMYGAFVYGDRSSTTNVTASANNQFVVRATGGTIFYADQALTSGVELLPGAGAWSTVSDRNRKHLFRDISGESVLAEIAAMPIQSWSYKSQEASIRHVGPTAQDFSAAFGLGSNELTITTSDISGINMLAIQALERRTRELADARAKLDELESRLAALEAALNGRMTTTVNR